MDKAKIFQKLNDGCKAVYLLDEDENCAMKVCIDESGDRVIAFLKSKGGEPYRVDITNEDIFMIMDESDETDSDTFNSY